VGRQDDRDAGGACARHQVGDERRGSDLDVDRVRVRDARPIDREPLIVRKRATAFCGDTHREDDGAAGAAQPLQRRHDGVRLRRREQIGAQLDDVRVGRGRERLDLALTAGRDDSRSVPRATPPMAIARAMAGLYHRDPPTLEARAVFSTWRDVYQSDLQGLYALIALPALFLVARIVAPRRVHDATGRFVRAWSLVFAVETIVDPLATGPLLRAAGITEGPLADYGMIPFVLLGDFRVFLLVCFVGAPDAGLGSALARASAWTLVVPFVAWSATAALRAALGDVPPTTIWIVYESAFAALAVVLRVRASRYCRAVLAYVAVYYALWATADVIILAGIDAGWVLRIVPNQLYYAFWVPFAELLFFSRRYAASSTSTHATR